MLRFKVTQRPVRNVSDKKLQDEVDKVVSETAYEMASVASQLAPKRTGALAKSIHVEEGAVTRVVAGKSYAQYPEYGTVHQAAQPYMRPAKNWIMRRMRDRLGEIHTEIVEELGTNTRLRK